MKNILSCSAYLSAAVMLIPCICFAPLIDKLENPKVQVHYELTGEVIKNEEVDNKISDEQFEQEWIALAKHNAGINNVTLDNTDIEYEKRCADASLNKYLKQEKADLQRKLIEKNK